MSDEHPFRPRRALSPEGEHVDPAQGDDSAADDTFSGRRGWLGESPTEQPDETTDAQAEAANDPEPQASTEPERQAPNSATSAPEVPAEHAAFMRPGAVMTPPVSTSPASTTPVSGAAAAADASLATAGGTAAAGESGPIDPVPLSEAATQAHPIEQALEGSGTPAVSSGSSNSASSPTSPVDAISAGSERPPRRFPRGAKIAAAVLVPALMAGAFFGVRALTHRNDVVVQETPTASSATPSATPTPPLSNASLVTVDDATAALGNSSWTEAKTWETVTEADPGITCMSNLNDQPSPTLTRQRGLSSQAKSKTAVLQRMDAFKTAGYAKIAFSQRLAALAACNDVPALIQSAATVSGTANEAFSMTIAFEDAETTYHTVLVTRTAETVTMTDVANAGQPISTDKALKVATESLTRLCTTSKGVCPTTPKSAPTASPATPIVGWLAQSDLPRVTKGQGMWSPTAPVKVSSKGTQCEDLTLATATGPIASLQRSYILTQDDAAPEGFGVDEVLFAFSGPGAAKSFSDKLIKNINACSSRTTTAKLSAQADVSTTGDQGAKVTGRSWKVAQAISANKKIYYRVSVTQAGSKVSYVVSNTTESFDFTDDAWKLVAERSGQRATQLT